MVRGKSKNFVLVRVLSEGSEVVHLINPLAIVKPLYQILRWLSSINSLSSRVVSVGYEEVKGV